MTTQLIKNWLSEEVVYTVSAPNFRDAIKMLIAKNQPLHYIDFRNLNLCDVDFTGADLAHANFCGSRLKNAVFTKANLSTTYFSGADLVGADFRGVDFAKDVILFGANLRGAKGVIQLQGDLPYNILFTPTHVKVGCQYHTWDVWYSFTNKEIIAMEPGLETKNTALYPKLLALMEVFEDQIREKPEAGR